MGLGPFLKKYFSPKFTILISKKNKECGKNRKHYLSLEIQQRAKKLEGFAYQYLDKPHAKKWKYKDCAKASLTKIENHGYNDNGP